MKQVLQSLENGETIIINSPVPSCLAKHVVIETTHSLISAGTERMLVDFGKASYLQKARQQPEKVRMVLDKVKTDGLSATIESVRSKLNQPIPLGYCQVGHIKEVGIGANEFKIGDRVVSNGHHAEVVRVSKNLCAKIPDDVDDESAAFTVIASIALQGIRLAKPEIGERAVVIGAGLIGLLAIQLLKAQGCQVLAIDLDSEKLKLAKAFGAETCNPSNGEDPVAKGMAFSAENGVDFVLITASTKSNEPVSQAARMSRKRGRIILVGVTGLELNRSEFYEKELSFQVSCSYGPGRYDPEYEEKGHDYPLGYVRWTEKRNFEAVLDLMADKKLNVAPLISHRFLFEQASEAYKVLTDDKKTLGIMLSYPETQESKFSKKIELDVQSEFKKDDVVLGLIGAGNYASRVLIPGLEKANTKLHTVVTSSGINGVIHGKKSGFVNASTDKADIFNEQNINTVMIASQHNTHAKFVVESLNAGKHVFVEKPLALNLEELSQIEAAYHTAALTSHQPKLMIGFNRRFSPLTKKMKKLLHATSSPKSFITTVNAGSIPADHWTQDKQVGGGRIIGEACHFIDLLRFLVGYPIIEFQVSAMAGAKQSRATCKDTATINLSFEDGSIGTIHYFANGSKSYPKETIEVFSSGQILKLNNFRQLKGYGWPGFKNEKLWKQDKGQNHCIKQFVESIQQGLPSPIPIEEIFEVSKVTIDVANRIEEI